MKHIIPVKAIVVGLILNAICLADNYTISLYFEQTEDALSTLFRTQVFPHPLGNHDGDAYDIYLWNPSIDIEPGVVNFNFEIYVDVVIAGMPIQYNYPFIIPLNIPSGELSITGIITFLEGIPTQINSMDGPQWVKNIIIDEYEGLELTVYPNSLLEAANESIPNFVDVTVNNASYTWEALSDLLQYSISIETIVNPPLITTEVWAGIFEDPNDDYYSFRFNTNVRNTVIQIVDYICCGNSAYVSYPDRVLIPDVPETINYQGNFGEGWHNITFYFASDYGWFGIRYFFYGSNNMNWTDLTAYISETL